MQSLADAIKTGNMNLIATYKKFERVADRWAVSTVKCYTNGCCCAVVVHVHGSKHSHEHVFANRDNANELVKRYIGYGFKRCDD